MPILTACGRTTHIFNPEEERRQATARFPTLALSLLTDAEVAESCVRLKGTLDEHERALRPLRLLLMTLREEQTRRLDARAER